MQPAHGLIEVVGDLKRIIETGEDANRPSVGAVTSMESRVETAGGQRTSVQAAAANKLPRRDAPRVWEFEIHRRPEAVHEDPSRQVVIGMAGQAR